MIKIFTSCLLLIPTLYIAQVIPNGTIDNMDELSKKETVYIPMEDGTLLYTDLYLPVFQDSIVTDVDFGGSTYTLQIIPKNSQFIIYDTTNITPESYQMPLIFTRTPYHAANETIGGLMFPFLGYGYAVQDMRGRYDSEGVYFPMFSDSWAKEAYHPNNPIPLDLTNTTDANNALKHADGKDALLYIADSLYRISDVDLDGVNDTILFCNGSIGMYGASALANSQYQALSAIPHSNTSNPVKCLLPIVGASEHYNSTLFHNGVYRHSLATGWTSGQIASGVYDTLVGTDLSLTNALHSPADYGYSSQAAVANDLIDWFVADAFNTSPSGAHPTSIVRMDLDASMAPVNSLGESDANGAYSRYNNLNKPTYHLTGWWDIFINGQIETFNKTRNANPSTNQKLVIGPWTHQTIGSNIVGDEVYPDNVFDVLNFDLDIDPTTILSDSSLMNDIYQSEMLYWFREHLGGEPFFIIPESQDWQTLGTNLIRIPSKNYIIPYYQFLNYIGGQTGLLNLPIQIDIGGSITDMTYDIDPMSPALVNLSAPLTSADNNHFDNMKDIRMYITGPQNDASNTNVGNYWFATDSLPFNEGIVTENIYLHQNLTADYVVPTSNEGTLSYTADPNNPVRTIGGNNMIPTLPASSQKSQGSINLANPNYANLTMNRSDVLQFITPQLTDTMTVIGFPKASLYAKGSTSTYSTTKTDFDLMIRILDVYPDGREMLITEGVVNAKSRDYAKSIFDADTNETILLTNIDNDTYHYFEFDLLPLGHTFGVDHQIKILVSSSNFPKYQSNPHVPNNANDFFRWAPGETTMYNYQGNSIGAQNCDITIEFNPTQPSFISLPSVSYLPTDIEAQNAENKFSIYPNPTKGVITINHSVFKAGQYDCYNVFGQQLKSISFDAHSTKIKVDLSDLPNGIYYLRNSNTKETKKIIINN